MWRAGSGARSFGGVTVSVALVGVLPPEIVPWRNSALAVQIEDMAKDWGVRAMRSVLAAVVYQLKQFVLENRHSFLMLPPVGDIILLRRDGPCVDFHAGII